jgi:GDP-L-fucose synthase
MEKNNQKIFVAGHSGMVGSAICRQLENESLEIITRTHSELDLTDQSKVSNFFQVEMPDQVYIAAGKVGGIYANTTFHADFIYDNIMIQTNIINSAFRSGVKKLLFIGSSSVYPKLSMQPMKEEYLMTGSLELSNEAYSIAKISGIKMCESYNNQYAEKFGISYRSIMPTNLYGVGDSYYSKNNHVVPALISRIHDAKVNNNSITVWGSGEARREFLYVDDLASASIFIMNIDKEQFQDNVVLNGSHINIGYGQDVSIKELVQTISDVVGFRGEIKYDITQPEGVDRKLLDSSRLNKLGWKPKIDLISGLKKAYKDFSSKNIII